MDAKTLRYYKKQCFNGRGLPARTADRLFFALLAGFSLWLLLKKKSAGLYLGIALALLLLFFFYGLGERRFGKYLKKLKAQEREKQGRNAFLLNGGCLKYPWGEALLKRAGKAGEEEVFAWRLKNGPDAPLHLLQEPDESLFSFGERIGCPVFFHGPEVYRSYSLAVSEEEVDGLLCARANRNNAGNNSLKKWKQISCLRYFAAALFLLCLSFFAKYSLYWRALSTLCALGGSLNFLFTKKP